MSGSTSAFQIRIGTQTLDLILREDGRLGLEGIFAKLGRRSSELEIKAFQAGNIVHKELAQLWLEEDDVTIFNGRSGKRVSHLRSFVPEMNTPYTILTPTDVVLLPPAPLIESENDSWRFHVYSAGLPMGLTAMVDQFPIRRLGASGCEQRIDNAGTLEVRADSMTHVTL
jgi:hypothetical protein